MEEKTKNENIKSKKTSIILIIILCIIIPLIALGAGITIVVLNNNNRTENTNPYITSEDDCNEEYIYSENDRVMVVKKPIIYLYPEEEKEINVELGNKELITSSYPKYISGWNVKAKPNGDLLDLDTNKNLYSLYYESDAINQYKVEKDGFVVEGEKIAEFLEEKLEILGLSDREKEEFIIYWLPELEKNKYNYIRFATEEEINANMSLVITPEPETTIRVLMTYKALEDKIDIEEQELKEVKRIGYTAVEWGATEIK